MECLLYFLAEVLPLAPALPPTPVEQKSKGHKNRKQNLASDSLEMMVNDTIPIYIPNSWTHKS